MCRSQRDEAASTLSARAAFPASGVRHQTGKSSGDQPGLALGVARRIQADQLDSASLSLRILPAYVLMGAVGLGVALIA